MPTVHVACAGAVVFDADGRLLLIQRATAPGAGLWSVPGGRCDPGEDSAAACVREVAEETGLLVSVARLAGRVERDGPSGVVFDIDDYVCTVTGGQLQAADDAAAVRWVTGVELQQLPLVAGLVEALREWDLLPR